MNRRTFISTATAGVAAGIAPGAAGALPGVDDTEGLYRAWFSMIERKSNDDACGGLWDDTEHRLMILAMISALTWGREAKITFEWTPVPDEDYEIHGPREPWMGNDHRFDDDGVRLWRCSAFRRGKLVATSDGWYADTRCTPVECRLVEAELSFAIRRSYDSIDDDYVSVDATGEGHWMDG